MTEPKYAQRYRLVESLPPGRAHALHRALDAAGRPVLVTVLRPADPDAFLRRLGAVSAARHLDLAGIIDAGRDGDECFVVTEEVRGRHAAQMAAGGPLPVGDVGMVGGAAAAALAALHAAGAVHGGVDPSCVVRTADGTVKLTGAGLAAGEAPPDITSAAPPDEARYLSPEEVAGHAPGAAADVYRLGLVLYLLATGAPAFDGPDALTVARAHVDGVVQPPQLRNPQVPPAMAQVILRALQKDPAQRGTAAQLRDDLQTVLGRAEVRAAPPPPDAPRRRAWPWVALALVVLALAALAGAWALGWLGGDDTPPKVKVPDVTGMTEARARSTLEQVGLKVGDVTAASDASAPQGTVVSQKPAAGTEVEKGAAVDLALSGGPSPAGVAVPDVVGLSRASAEQALSVAGFLVAVSEAPSSSVPAGTVSEQSPSAGVMAAEGSRVTIVVSTGTPTPTTSPTTSPSP